MVEGNYFLVCFAVVVLQLLSISVTMLHQIGEPLLKFGPRIALARAPILKAIASRAWFEGMASMREQRKLRKKTYTQPFKYLLL